VEKEDSTNLQLQEKRRYGKKKFERIRPSRAGCNPKTSAHQMGIWCELKKEKGEIFKRDGDDISIKWGGGGKKGTWGVSICKGHGAGSYLGIERKKAA